MPATFIHLVASQSVAEHAHTIQACALSWIEHNPREEVRALRFQTPPDNIANFANEFADRKHPVARLQMTVRPGPG